ncbi:MAG: winged helix-turn-helix transcriptional regulator [Mobilitalea sp.]
MTSLQIFAEIPPRVEYTSTDSGKQLQEIFTQMCHWDIEYALAHIIIINCGKS